ncbi:secreted lipase [Trichophyton mentagrophytes]|nr:secreted lipase [Trichophyton mentagrophytes]
MVVLPLFFAFFFLVQGNCQPQDEIPYARKYLYVGGQYADDGTGGHIFRDQMYVEHLVPSKGPTKQQPIVLLHGQAQTGTNWLNKPDGGRGWASYFIEHGYECYVVDQTSRGRSPWIPENGTMAAIPAEMIQKLFTATARYKLWPEAELHTQWPGSGVIGDPIFDAYYASTVQFLKSQIQQETTIQAAGAALLDRIGRPVILVTHSQAGAHGWLVADARPELVHSIIALEPAGPPFENVIYKGPYSRVWGLTNAPLTYSPAVVDPETEIVKQTIDDRPGSRCIIQADSPPPRQLTNLRGIRTLVVTAEASFHRPTDWCVVRYMEQAGISVDHVQLGDIGIRGNGHMLFLERNSDEIAAVLRRWMEEKDTKPAKEAQEKEKEL